MMENDKPGAMPGFLFDSTYAPPQPLLGGGYDCYARSQ